MKQTYIHLLVHEHKYGETRYFFSSNKKYHKMSKQFKNKLIKFFNIEIDDPDDEYGWADESLELECNIEIKTLI